MSENNFKFLKWVKMSANSISGKIKNARKWLFQNKKMSENGSKKCKNVRKIFGIKMPSNSETLSSMIMSELWKSEVFSEILVYLNYGIF